MKVNEILLGPSRQGAMFVNLLMFYSALAKAYLNVFADWS
jgi:hypothetical protein